MEKEMLKEHGRHNFFGMRDLATAYLIESRDILDPDEDREPKWRLPEGVTPIPGERKSCQPVLVAFVDEHDGCDRLLLEAVEYLAGRCSGVTKYVIFHAGS
jgi:hypothetical protein